jgi:hypothetical protein
LGKETQSSLTELQFRWLAGSECELFRVWN